MDQENQREVHEGIKLPTEGEVIKILWRKGLYPLLKGKDKLLLGPWQEVVISMR